ncbi:6913_t:CDS:2, partial [Racocetra persica]
VFEKCENEIRKIIEQISEYENINYKDDDIVATNFFIDLYRYFIPPEEAAKHSKSKVPINKVLDPACGSGIFLTSYIKKLIEEKRELTNKDFTNNIFGIDLNPIAVLQARINYLLTIRNYYQKEETVEIPLDTQIGEVIEIYLPMEINLSDVFFEKLARNIKWNEEKNI